MIAGCGGGAKTSDPEAVASAFVESYYGCGEEGAGVRADLAYPAEEAEEHRLEVAEEEAPGGCEPREPQEVTTASVPRPVPTVAIEISSEDCPPELVPVIEIDGNWFVDESEALAGLFCPDIVSGDD